LAVEPDVPGLSYSTNLLGTLGRGGLGFLDRLDGFATTAAMAVAIKASKSVSTFGTCGGWWR
jgi:hypothetical protein